MEESQNRRLFASMMRLRKGFSHVQNHAGLKQGEFFALQTIAHPKRHCDRFPEISSENSVKISTLSKLLDVSMPAASQMVNALEEKGLVERVASKNDRRVVQVSLTKEGEALMNEVMAKFNHFIDRVVSRFGDQNTETLIRLFEELYDIVEDVKNEMEIERNTQTL